MTPSVLGGLARLGGAIGWGFVAAASAAFPVYVALNPDKFGPERIASPIEGDPDPMAREGGGRFAALRPLIDRSPPAPAEPGVEPNAALGDGAMVRRVAPPVAERIAPHVPARPTFRRYDVRALARGAVLVDDGDGLALYRPGDVLPDGSRLVRADKGGLRVEPPAEPAPSPASPAQADAGSVQAWRDANAHRID